MICFELYTLNLLYLLTGRTSRFWRNFLETEMSASCGHSWNQLIAVELTRAGNLRARIRKVAPTGEKHKTTFSWRRTRSIKNFQQFSLVSRRPAPFTCKIILYICLYPSNYKLVSIGTRGTISLKIYSTIELVL